MYESILHEFPKKVAIKKKKKKLVQTGDDIVLASYFTLKQLIPRIHQFKI